MSAPFLSDAELHAFIDGALDDARTREIAALVGADAALAERIAAFRADKPLPQGCASDIPLKAMDEENAERDRRAGK